jgi:CcmD family protein
MLRTIGSTVRAILMTIVMVGVLAPATHAAAPQQPPTGQSEFVPLDDLPPPEQVAAAPLLVAAYAIAWLVLLFYLWSIWRRLGAVERELAAVTRRVETEARRS